MNAEELFLTRRVPMIGMDADLYPNLKPGRPGIIRPPVLGYVGWWDASDVSSAGMTLDATGLRATTWKDKSGSGFDGTAAAAAIGLIGRHPSKMNRLNLINDQGTHYSTSCPADDRTQTVFFVGIIRDLSVIRPLVGANNTAGRLLRVETTGKLSVLSQFTLNLFTTSTLAVTAGTPFVACAIIDTTTIEIRLNTGTAESTSNSTTFTAGRTTVIGADPNGANAYDGWIGEVLIYGTALSSADATSIMNYLRSKWGI